MLNPEQYRPRKVREPVESGTATGDGEDCMKGSDTKRSETSTRPPSTATQLGRSPVRSWLSALNPAWYRDLYTIGSVAGTEAVLLRVTLAVGAPLIVGTLMNHPTAGYVGGATALFVTQCDIGESAAVGLCTMFSGWTAIALGRHRWTPSWGNPLQQRGRRSALHAGGGLGQRLAPGYRAGHALLRTCGCGGHRAAL
jgi:hypothetical protein